MSFYADENNRIVNSSDHHIHDEPSSGSRVMLIEKNYYVDSDNTIFWCGTTIFETTNLFTRIKSYDIPIIQLVKFIVTTSSYTVFYGLLVLLTNGSLHCLFFKKNAIRPKLYYEQELHIEPVISIHQNFANSSDNLDIYGITLDGKVLHINVDFITTPQTSRVSSLNIKTSRITMPHLTLEGQNGSLKSSSRNISVKTLHKSNHLIIVDVDDNIWVLSGFYMDACPIFEHNSRFVQYTGWHRAELPWLTNITQIITEIRRYTETIFILADNKVWCFDSNKPCKQIPFSFPIKDMYFDTHLILYNTVSK